MATKTLTIKDYERLRHGGEVHLRCIVTPQVAEKMLANMPRNRNVIESHVEALAGIIQADRWAYDGCPVQVGHDGSTFGGLHRLTACVRAGRPIEVLVIFGLDCQTITNAYVSRPWQMNHFLDYQGERKTKCLAATIRHLARFESGNPIGKTVKPTAEDAIRLLGNHPSLRESVEAVESLRNVLPQSIAAISHYYFRQKDAGLCDRFFDGLVTGASLGKDHPILILRDRLMDNRKDSKSKLKEQEVLALMVKAWNHCREGKSKIKYLRWGAAGNNTEAFPAIK